MTATTHQAGRGREWRTQTARITCDGADRSTDYVCRLSTPVDGTTAREARSVARGMGWSVDLPNPKGRRRLDYCPDHEPHGATSA